MNYKILTRMTKCAGIALAAIVCLGMLLPSSSYAQEVRNCDSIAEADVQIAVDFITDNQEEILTGATTLEDKHKDEFRRKWPRFKIRCKDDGGRCLRKPSAGGYAHGGLGNRVRVCYYNIVEVFVGPATICDVVDIIVHEVGHANGYPRSKGHNNLSDAEKLLDPIYQLGDGAKDVCLDQARLGNFNNVQLSGTVQRTIGAECAIDDQCASGKCGSNDECVCNDDGDCPSGQECFKPVGKVNYCELVAHGLGAACSRNEQCRSDKCEDDECVCRADSDCPASEICKTPVSAKNYCEAGSSGTASLGAACSSNSDCRSDKCGQDDVCVCKRDSDCPSGESCYTPVGGKNYCESTSLNLGASCNRNSQCRSDKCEKSECVCKNNSDCPTGERCRTPVAAKNYCD